MVVVASDSFEPFLSRSVPLIKNTICSLTYFSSILMVFILKSTPIVLKKLVVKVLSAYLINMQDLPTPLFPIRRSFIEKSLFNNTDRFYCCLIFNTLYFK